MLTWITVAWLVCGTARAQSPEDMEPLTWLEVANTRLREVAPEPGEFEGTWGNVGVEAVVSAWNGGAINTTRGRLIVTGGGHADYYGNELYTFEIATMTWQRLTDPTANPTAGSDVNWDGTPQSRHTYNGLAYVSHRDAFFMFAGAGSTIGDSGFPPTDHVWTFDFASGAWSGVHTPAPGGPPASVGSGAIYDPMTRIVWYGEGHNSGDGDGWGLWAWDVETETWTRHTRESVFYGATGCLDTRRGLLIFVGDGRVSAFDVRSGTPALMEWETSGDDAIEGASFPGVDYDPVLDRVVAWNGGPVYALDPETRVWTAIDAPGAPSAHANGTFGRFRYVPSVNAFVSVNSIDENVFFFKHGEGTGMPLPDAGMRIDGGGRDGGAIAGGDAGTTARRDAASGDPGDADGGCGCRASAGGDPLALLFLAALLVRRRRLGAA
jgi:MYXO-CTERM domain-containing protein